MAGAKIGVDPMMDKQPEPKMRLDITKVSMVGDVSLNDEVEIKVKGRVTSIRGPEHYIGTDYLGKGKEKEVERMYPGSLEVEISSVAIATVNQFEGMDSDD
jgi:hypothetical protein